MVPPFFRVISNIDTLGSQAEYTVWAFNGVLRIELRVVRLKLSLLKPLGGLQLPRSNSLDPLACRDDRLELILKMLLPPFEHFDLTFDLPKLAIDFLSRFIC